jgi:multidrug resistance efflux pump
VNTLEAQLVNAQGSMRDLEEQEKGAAAKISEAAGRTHEVSARLELTRKRVEQYRELAKTGAGNRFDLERAEADLAEQQAQFTSARSAEAAARAGERQVQQKLGAKVGSDYAQVAQVRAQLAHAKWELDQTSMYSPCECYVINLQLRPGSFVGQVALASVMTLVEAEGQVVALYYQNELHQVQPGNEAEFTLDTLPGKVIKAKVDSIVWAQGQGQLTASGIVPNTGFAPLPAGRYAVKFNIEDRDKDLFLAAGAVGHAAIYTEHGEAIHILRKVILRVGSYINYLILKLH